MSKTEKMLRKKFFKIIFIMFDITSKEIEEHLHVTKSYVSKYLCGERISPEIDIYIIEKIFGIKIKDYSYNA